MLVYRVEHPSNGLGPYHPDTVFAQRNDMCDDHNFGFRRKSDPFEDVGRHFRPGIHVCALSTIKALTAWFDGWLRPLHTQGFVISVYDTFDDVKVSRATGQCVFDKERATLIQSKPIFPTDKPNV